MTGAGVVTASASHTPAPVAVVVVTHQSCDEIAGFLASVPDGVETVVVDCGSSDDTVAVVRDLRPDVRVLELANAGFARGANAGVRCTTAEVVVVANPDVVLEPGCVEHLARTIIDDSGLGAAGPMVRYPSGAPQASARALPSPSTAIGHAAFARLVPSNRWTRRYRQQDADPSVARDADWLSGCVLALRRAAFDEVGGFDPGYDLFVEDVDLGVRLRDAGWRLRYEPLAGAIHHVGASTRTRPISASIAHARGIDRFVRRHLDTAWLRILRPMLRVGLALWVVARVVSRARSDGSYSATGEPTGSPSGSTPGTPPGSLPASPPGSPPGSRPS